MSALARIVGPTAVLTLLVVAGCTVEQAPMPAACTGEPEALIAALERAPRAVVLSDGARLSDCIERARTDADRQSLGIALLRTADALREPAATDPDAALRLGYLVGAVGAAAEAGDGTTAQLGRRLAQIGRPVGASAAARAALRRGLLAGEHGG